MVAPDNSPTTAKPAQDLLPLDAPPIPDNTPTAVAEPAPGVAGGNPDGVEKVLFEQPYAEALPFGAQWECRFSI